MLLSPLADEGEVEKKSSSIAAVEGLLFGVDL